MPDVRQMNLDLLLHQSPEAGVMPDAARLHILSFQPAGDLAEAAEAAGWVVYGAADTEVAAAQLEFEPAHVVAVDARGDIARGIRAVAELAPAVEAGGGALIAIVDGGDAAQIDELLACGATDFIVAPFTADRFGQALRVAAGHAERVRKALTGREAGPAPKRGKPRSTAKKRRAPGALASFGRNRLMEIFRKLEPDGGPAAPVQPAPGRVSSPAPLQQSRDPLTGLRDLRAARAWIDEHLRASGEDPPGLVLLLLGISRFDAINAAFGRWTGDGVLQAAGRRIERMLGGDMRARLVARLAGAEFAIVLAEPAGVAEGRLLAGQLAEAIGRPFMCGDHAISLACSVGVVASASGDSAAALLRRASTALIEAQNGDAGPIRVLHASADSASGRGDQLEIDLRSALDRDEIEILFQPQVSIGSGRIVGAEALARWRHPSFGELGAATLFAAAQRSDYLAQLSEHVQRKAIGLGARWGAALDTLRLSVNITASDIVRPGFAGQFIRMAENHKFQPGRLTVEVTESGLIEDLNAAAHLLAELREAGMRVAIDDFGTGYSSLAYLKALPLDYLKIDKRLCEDITGSHRDRVVVRSVIDMARSLGLDVIAEGVESREQLDLLAEEGCTLYQGFLCSPPIGAAAFAEIVGTPEPA